MKLRPESSLSSPAFPRTSNSLKILPELLDRNGFYEVQILPPPNFLTKVKLTVTKGERRGGINWEIGIDIYTLLYIKEITNKNLLCRTGK